MCVLLTLFKHAITRKFVLSIYGLSILTLLMCQCFFFVSRPVQILFFRTKLLSFLLLFMGVLRTFKKEDEFKYHKQNPI